MPPSSCSVSVCVCVCVCLRVVYSLPLYLPVCLCLPASTLPLPLSFVSSRPLSSLHAASPAHCALTLAYSSQRDRAGQFCASLCALMTKAWLPMDQWIVNEGRWIRPRNVALASNAFGDKISRSGVRTTRRFDEDFFTAPKPYSTLLNRAKGSRSSAGAVPKFMMRGGKKATAGSMPSVVVPKDMKDIEMSAVIIQRAARARALAPKSPSPSFKREGKLKPDDCFKEDERTRPPPAAPGLAQAPPGAQNGVKSSETSGAKVALLPPAQQILPPICPPAQ